MLFHLIFFIRMMYKSIIEISTPLGNKFGMNINVDSITRKSVLSKWSEETFEWFFSQTVKPSFRL